jgi:phage gp46-like protein
MDILLSWDTQRFRGDWTVTPGDAAIDPGGLQTAVLISLFTDAAATDDYEPPAGAAWERRGWWGDTYEPLPAGSNLWQLNRAKKTAATLLTAQDYCSAALQWMINAGVVRAVQVACSWLDQGTMSIGVKITNLAGNQQTLTYAWAWQSAGG